MLNSIRLVMFICYLCHDRGLRTVHERKFLTPGIPRSRSKCKYTSPCRSINTRSLTETTPRAPPHLNFPPTHHHIRFPPFFRSPPFPPRFQAAASSGTGHLQLAVHDTKASYVLMPTSGHQKLTLPKRARMSRQTHRAPRELRQKASSVVTRGAFCKSSHMSRVALTK